MSLKLKEVFKVEIDGEERELAVVRPSPKVMAEGQRVHNRAFRDAVESGAILRAKVDAVIREQKLWDDARAAEYIALHKKIADNKKKIDAGGIRLSQGRDLALESMDARNRLSELTAERNVIDEHTAEAQAENARFNFYVSACTLDNKTGKSYFASYEDYQARNTESAAFEAAQRLAMLLHGLDKDFRKKLPEVQFLIKHKLVDAELRLIDKRGQYVDRLGRRVDKDGNLINDKGQRVDSEGSLLTADGEYVVEAKPFLDDDDQPILSEEAKADKNLPATEPEKPSSDAKSV